RSPSAVRNSPIVSSLTATLFQFREDRRNDLVEVADHRPVGARDDRGVLVLVDHEDPLGSLAADDVLDRAADAAGDVEGGRDPRPALSDLVGVQWPAEVGDDRRAPRRTAEAVR